MVKELILLGSGPTGWDCPFNAELWVTAAMLPNIDPDCTKVFAFGTDDSEGLEIARRHNIPVVSPDNFPRAEIVARFGLDYFWSPLSYMLAYALYLGYESLKIYGFDLETPEEYQSGKPRITFWLGVAKGMGVRWAIAERSKLYRALKENVKNRYKRAMALKNDVTPEDYVAAMEKHGDPYAWVTGLDKDAVSVKCYDRAGKEVCAWRP